VQRRLESGGPWFLRACIPKAEEKETHHAKRGAATLRFSSARANQTRRREAVSKFASLIALLIVAALPLRSALPSLGPDEVNALLQKSMEKNQAYWTVAPEYEYVETDQQPNGGTKTYQELVILGSTYERLIAINGKPLSTEREAQEQQKLNATIARRRNESQEEREQRLAKAEQVRKRDHALIQEIPKAFDFEYLDERQLASRDCYVLQANPKAGYRPPNRETEVLKGARGWIWIDKETYNWVKAKAEVIRPVSIVAYLARVEPGTRFELDMAPVSDGLWMPSHFTMQARAKILFVFPHEASQDETYYGYREAAQY
jgi:hypothetical protein